MQTPDLDLTARTWDALVIGGGAAGLAGATALGRSRRSVLVLDAGEPRNAPAAGVHNYLGREDTAPGELMALGRAEAAGYGVQIAPARVAAVRPGPDGGFVVSTEDGRDLAARRVLVATGATDVLPDLPGLAERWGHDVLHCPYCHGWEVRDRAIVVLGTGPMATHQALLFRQLTDDVVVALAADAPRPSPEDAERLAARGVRVLEDPPVRVVLADGPDRAVRGVELASGEVLACDAVVVSSQVVAHADFLAPLGLETEPMEVGGHVLGTRLPTGQGGLTSVPGVWAAGNVAEPMAQVVASAAAGLQAGAMINADLVAEEAQAAVDARRTPVH